MDVADKTKAKQIVDFEIILRFISETPSAKRKRSLTRVVYRGAVRIEIGRNSTLGE